MRTRSACSTKWRDDLVAEAGEKFPEKVTAFRAGMAAHGRYGKPCPVCGTPIQRIQYADNEANYCPACQTGGKLFGRQGSVPALERRLASFARRARKAQGQPPLVRNNVHQLTTREHAAPGRRVAY